TQRWGLRCALVRSPELLLLDEPTVGVDPLSRRELWEIILHLVHEQGITVLLSTSYLDEAEHCEHVVILHQGKVLAHGSPAAIAQRAAGRTFLAQPPAGHKARELQARLLDTPDIIDAVPEGGRVRFVRAQDGLGPLAPWESGRVGEGESGRGKSTGFFAPPPPHPLAPSFSTVGEGKERAVSGGCGTGRPKPCADAVAPEAGLTVVPTPAR